VLRYEQQWHGWRVTGVAREARGAGRAAVRDHGGAAGQGGAGAGQGGAGAGQESAGAGGQDRAGAGQRGRAGAGQRGRIGAADREDSSGPVQSVDRAAAILEILARDGEAGVTEIARELGVHKSTASRLLAALDRRELVAQDTARGKFRLGVGLLRLAGAAGRGLDLTQESRPVCRALAQEVGETVNLAILSGRDALYLDQVAGPAALSPHNWAGQRIPLHATSDGKILLAYLPAAEIVEHLALPLERFTGHTVTAVPAFGRLLAQARKLGYATAVDELEEGLTAVAAPVRNAEGTVIASVSASGPSFRITAGRIPEIAGAVQRAADAISRRLGWAAHMEPQA
jgi:IclR family transcriptional regulator, acetate operon repressor